ncbi:MAG: Do family serine endopeptidase [Gemmatimonadaceae bacterium]|nr:Do family serine endopeptidase [Gemmatimonadaceae bacterium]
MTSRISTRLTVGVVAVAAFIGGLVVAAGFNLTPFGYAQQAGGGAKPPQAAVQQVTEASNAFVAIAEHVTPAVVSIQMERQARPMKSPHGQQQIPPGMEDFFKQFDPRQQQQQQPMEGSGSGFLVTADGYILTNNHVVADADKLTVTLLDKRVFKAKVIGRDPTTDVAVIKIDGTNFPTIGFGDDDKARVGEWVLAVGNPLGLDFTVTAGIISAKGRSGQLRGLYASQYAIVDYIQTDAAINPGNSGGPLVNSHGDVIGINSAIASGTGYYSGYGFAIPITLAKTVMNDLIQFGKVRRAILGVSISDLRPEDAQAAGLKEIRGALVGGGTPGQSSPAEQAGIEAGDVIVAIDGTSVDRVAQLQRVIRVHKPGETVSVDVMRYGQKHTYKVKLTEAPNESQLASGGDESDVAADSAVAKPASYDKLGISVEQMTTDRASRAEVTDAQRGLVVMSVDALGPSYQKLFAESDVIVRVLNPMPHAIRTVADLDTSISRLKSGDVVSLLVYNTQQKQSRVVNLRIGG